MKISIVAPMYNEAPVLGVFLEVIHAELDKTGEDYEVICINDGSRDNTLALLKQAKIKYPNVRVLNLSRNFGKEPAMTAGIDAARGDVVIPIDADLQDPPELIHQMLDAYRQGKDVVLAKRACRDSDGFAKRASAGLFYKFIGKISHIDIPENVGDYRLMSRRVVDTLKELKETQRFMKGLFAWPGYETATIEYVRPERAAGETSFNGWKLWNFAIEGITSFSVAPLKIWTYIGALVSFVAFIYAAVIIFNTLVYGVSTPGYASLMVVVLFIGGVQLIGLGVIGEYIGRIYMESKQRPVYVLEDEY